MSKKILFGFIGLGILGLVAWVFVKSLGPQPVSEPNQNAQSEVAVEVKNDAIGQESNPNAASSLGENNTNPDLSTDEQGLSKATVSLQTPYGVVKFKFYAKDAPKTTARIVELIQSGFYNGLVFHRVVPGFVVQGGDPQGNGTGGSGQKLKAEFNKRRHIEGTVAMARAADPDSADSQFYICLGTHPHLDQNYTVFGQVVEGMEFVRKIRMGDKMAKVVIQ